MRSREWLASDTRGVSKVVGVVLLVAIVLLLTVVAGTAALQLSETQEPPTQIAAEPDVTDDRLELHVEAVQRPDRVDVYANGEKIRDDYVPKTGDTLAMTNMSKGDPVRLVSEPENSRGGSGSAYVAYETEAPESVGTPGSPPKLVDRGLPCGASGGGDILVASNGEGDYETIDPAITNASDGDTIFVADCGSEYAVTTSINKNLTFKSNYARVTGDTSVFFTQTADTLVIDGFRVRDAHGGVDVTQVSSATVRDTKFEDITEPAVYSRDADALTVTNVTVSNSGVGVSVTDGRPDRTTSTTIRGLTMKSSGGVYIRNSDVSVTDLRCRQARSACLDMNGRINGTVSGVVSTAPAQPQHSAIRTTIYRGDTDVSDVLSRGSSYGIVLRNHNDPPAEATSDWRFENVTVNNAQYGIYWDQGGAGASARAVVTEACIENTGTAVATNHASAGVRGQFKITESSLVGSSNYDVANDDAPADPITVTDTYWGQPGGPSPGEYTGNVDISNNRSLTTCS